MSRRPWSEMNGCRNVELTPTRSLCPANDQMWLPSIPNVQGPSCLRTTAVGPAPHLPVPSNSSVAVAVGMRNAGPAPQTMPLSVGFEGEKKKLWVMSPRPTCVPDGPAMSFCQVSGRMVREMTFQSSFIANGMTGWLFSVALSPSFGP
jgi:hypothetical protein